jgi:hypothetical protein
VEKVFPANGGPHKQAGIAILISDKVDFKLKSIRINNEGHFILKRNINAPNTKACIYIKKKKKKKLLMLLRAQIDANTVIVGDLNTLMSPID